MTKNTTARKRSRIVGLSQEEIAKVKALKKTDCPRCYCYWWGPYKFEFKTPIIEGCTVDGFLFQKDPNEPSVCSRATGDPLDRDFHEPLQAYLINDGFSPYYFFSSQTNQTFVYLEALHFEGDPTEITEAIGFEPTKTWKKDDPAAPNSIYICCLSGWRLYSSLSLSESVESHLDNLLSKLEMNAEAVKVASDKFTLGIQILDKAHHMKKFSLSNSMLDRINKLGLSLDFVHYHIPYDYEEKSE